MSAILHTIQQFLLTILDLVIDMKRKTIITVVLIIVLILLLIPFDVKSKDVDAARQRDTYTHYRAILWRYDYTCLGMNNNGAWFMEEKVTLFGVIPIYTDTEYMRLTHEGNLIPWNDGAFDQATYEL